MNESNHSSNYFYDKYDDISSLELTVKNHPLSSFARLLLLKQYHKTENPRFDDLARQTAVYFNDPQWLAFQILRENEEEKFIYSDNETSVLAEKEKTFTEDEASENNLVLEDVSAAESNAESGKTGINDGGNLDPVPVEEELINEGKSEEIENISTPPGENTVDNSADINVADDVENQVEPPNEVTIGEELVFEPLHTTDYFASQGVTIKEEIRADDKLGKQMRSFSEWLKSMKQLHPNKLPEQNEVIEKIIQSSAEQSNIGSEVLTEAMAEVLIKQNKQQKAIEMYEKLSLMNPSKSIYFAAKIDKIKNN